MLYTADADNNKISGNIATPSGEIIATKDYANATNSDGSANSFANKYYFYHYDIRGSLTTLLKPDATFEQGYSYDEYGNATVENSASLFHNEMSYTGAISDSTTGLSYMNARYYNPATGTFTSQDTYYGSAYSPWTQHLYSYTGGNPVNYIDPTGHFVLVLAAGAVLVDLAFTVFAVYLVYTIYEDIRDYYSDTTSTDTSSNISSATSTDQGGTASSTGGAGRRIASTGTNTSTSSSKTNSTSYSNDNSVDSTYQDYTTYVDKVEIFKPSYTGNTDVENILNSISNISVGINNSRNIEFARKPDLKQVDDVARRFGLDRKKFGRFVEDSKGPGQGGNHMPYFLLEELAREFIEWNK